MDAIRQALLNSPTKKTNTNSQSSLQKVQSKTSAVNKSSKIELKSKFIAPSQVHPALRPSVNTSSPPTGNKSTSPKLVKVSAHNLSSRPILHETNSKKAKATALKLNILEVPVLYSLDELRTKKRKLKEKSKRLQSKNDPLLLKAKTTIAPTFNFEEEITLVQNTESQSVKTKPSFEVENTVGDKNTNIVEDDDSDIEVEEINIVSKPEQFNSVSSESDMGAVQSNFVISGIMKQVEELEATLKMSVAKKESELQAEKQVVEQLQKKNQILELRDKKRKEAMERRDNEAAKEVEKRNNEIETLKSFTNSMAQKLSQKQREMETMENFTKKQSDLISQKQNELTSLGIKFDKVSSDLNSLQKWKSAQVVKDKENFNLKKSIQDNLAKAEIYKQRIEALEKSNKEKDELIAKHEKVIQSMDVKIGDKDRLAKELKLKVSKLITEFTKGFKDKDEQLDDKNQEIKEKSSEIERLKGKMLEMKRKVSTKNKDIESKEFMNNRQATIIQDLSTKLESAEIDSKQKETLHKSREQQAIVTIQNLENRNAENELNITLLQNKLSKLKTLHTNGFIIENEDIFEDKLEQFMYNFYGNHQKNKPPMLTYSWPVFSVEVDPCLLKERQEEGTKEKTISEIKIQVKPLMLTYLWPVLLFQHQVKDRNIPCRVLKRKISITSSDKSVRLCPEYFNSHVSLPKTVEQVTILDDLSEFKEDEETGISHNKNHNWPIVALSQAVSNKRKFEDMIELEVKKIKLDTEMVTKSAPGDISANIETKNWPVMVYSSNFSLNGTMKMDSCKRQGGRNKLDICKMEFSKQEVLNLSVSCQVKSSFFDTIYKEIKLADKSQSRNVQEISDKGVSWPMVIYKENAILQNLEVAEDENKPVLVDEDLDSTLELTLQDFIGTKRKCEDIDSKSFKKIKISDDTQNIVEFINDTLDYIISKVY